MQPTQTITMSGIVFYLTEEAYQFLRAYLDQLNAYFAKSADRGEIMADIENRLAEVLSSKRTNTQEVISLEVVTAVCSAIGNPSDFEEMEEVEANTSTQSNSEPKVDSGPAAANNPTPPQSRQLARISQLGKIAGIAAGLGKYLGIDITVVRIVLVVLFFGFAFLPAIPGTILIGYIVLWIVLPNTKPEETTYTQRKLFRAPDGKLGGVAKGLAMYLGVDVTLMRLLFFLGIPLGTFVIYLALWIVADVATTPIELLQMRGEPVNLGSIEDAYKNYGANINPSVTSIGPKLSRVLGLIVGIPIFSTGIGLIIGAISLLAVQLALIPTEFFLFKEMVEDPEAAIVFDMLLNGPGNLWLALELFLGVLAIFLLSLGLRLIIFKRIFPRFIWVTQVFLVIASLVYLIAAAITFGINISDKMDNLNSFTFPSQRFHLAEALDTTANKVVFDYDLKYLDSRGEASKIDISLGASETPTNEVNIVWEPRLLNVDTTQVNGLLDDAYRPFEMKGPKVLFAPRTILAEVGNKKLKVVHDFTLTVPVDTRLEFRGAQWEHWLAYQLEKDNIEVSNEDLFILKIDKYGKLSPIKGCHETGTNDGDATNDQTVDVEAEIERQVEEGIQHAEKEVEAERRRSANPPAPTKPATRPKSNNTEQTKEVSYQRKVQFIEAKAHKSLPAFRPIFGLRPVMRQTFASA